MIIVVIRKAVFRMKNIYKKFKKLNKDRILFLDENQIKPIKNIFAKKDKFDLPSRLGL